MDKAKIQQVVDAVKQNVLRPMYDGLQVETVATRKAIEHVVEQLHEEMQAFGSGQNQHSDRIDMLEAKVVGIESLLLDLHKTQDAWAEAILALRWDATETESETGT